MDIEIIPEKEMKNYKDKLNIEMGKDDIKVDTLNSTNEYSIEDKEDKDSIKVDIIDKDKDFAFFKMRESHYRDKLSSHVDEFKKMIRDNGGKAVIKLRYIRDILGSGYQTYEEKSDNAISSRVKETLLEYGIKANTYHHFGANLIMILTDANYADVIELQRMRYLKTAIRAGFDTHAEYARHSPARQKNLKLGLMEDAIDCSHYLGGYVERKFVSSIFPDAEPNPIPLGPYSKRGWDWKYKNDKRSEEGNEEGNIIKIKHIASTLRVIYDPNDLNWTTGKIRRRELFQWGIYENQDADVFIMTGWKDRKSLELLHAWVIDKNDIVNGRRFCDRQSFAINNHKFSLKKYSKYEIDIKDGRFEELKKDIDNRNKKIIKKEREEKMKEIRRWYATHFR